MLIFHADGTGAATRLGRYVPVFRTNDNEEVVNGLYERIGGAALDLLTKAISKVDIRSINPAHREHIAYNVDFGHEIGYSLVVPTLPDDDIIWAQRPFRQRLSRMVRGRLPLPSKNFTVVLEQPEGTELFFLCKAYIGTPLPAEPCDYYRILWRGMNRKTRQRIRSRTKEFWSTHAFVYSHTQHDPDSRTRNCPDDDWAEILGIDKKNDETHDAQLSVI